MERGEIIANTYLTAYSLNLFLLSHRSSSRSETTLSDRPRGFHLG